MFKYILYVGLLILILSSTGFATPELDITTRNLFLGYDSTYYYYISIEERGIGSYYDYKECAYLYKHRLDGSGFERTVLSEIYLSQPNADPQEEWQAKPSERDDDAIARYFTSDNLRFPMPGLPYKFRKIKQKYEFIFWETGLYINFEHASVLLLTPEQINKYLHIKLESLWSDYAPEWQYPTEVRFGNNPIEYFACGKYLILHVRSGPYCPTEALIPISIETIRQAEQTLTGYFTE